MATHIKTIVCGPGGGGAHRTRARARTQARNTFVAPFPGEAPHFRPVWDNAFRAGRRGGVGGWCPDVERSAHGKGARAST